jgi:hypothetical protein
MSGHLTNKGKVFHGGCLDCTSQEKFGIDRCYKCQYYNDPIEHPSCDWSKPDLSIEYNENIDYVFKERTENQQKECRGCGAPKNNYKCEYCGRTK